MRWLLTDLGEDGLEGLGVGLDEAAEGIELRMVAQGLEGTTCGRSTTRTTATAPSGRCGGRTGCASGGSLGNSRRDAIHEELRT